MRREWVFYCTRLLILLSGQNWREDWHKLVSCIPIAIKYVQEKNLAFYLLLRLYKHFFRYLDCNFDATCKWIKWLARNSTNVTFLPVRLLGGKCKKRGTPKITFSLFFDLELIHFTHLIWVCKELNKCQKTQVLNI